MRQHVLICAAALLVAACDTTLVTGTCVPGKVEACPCLSGGQGVQACQSNGLFGSCECPDAGVDVDLTLPDLTPEADLATPPDLMPFCARALAGSDFDDPTAWTAGGGTAISAGQAHLPSDANCFATLSQRACVGPVVGSSDVKLVVTGNSTGSMSQLSLATASGPTQLVGAAKTGTPLEICLGERAHTSDTLFLFGRTCSDIGNPSMDLDSIVLQSSGCPIPGAVLNGDFAAAGSGWTAVGQTSGSADYSAGNAKLLLPDYCSDVFLTGWISVPTSALVKPALRFTITVTGTNREVAVSAGTANDSITVGVTAATLKHICLSAGNKGLASRVRFSTQRSVGGSCASTPGDQVVIDDVQLYDDATCP